MKEISRDYRNRDQALIQKYLEKVRVFLNIVIKIITVMENNRNNREDVEITDDIDVEI